MFIVFDLDGTLADDAHRQHHITGDVRDWDAYFAACGDDAPIIEPVMELLLTLDRGIMMSRYGRAGRSTKSHG